MTREAMQTVNLILSALIILPSIVLIVAVLMERCLILPQHRRLNKALSLVFIATGISALGNALIAALSILGFGLMAHEVSPSIRLLSNILFFTASWTMLWAYHELKK